MATAAASIAAIPVSGAWVAVATPLHLVAGLTSVSVPPEAILELDAAEAQALARDFNGAFGTDGLRLVCGAENLLLCVFDAPLQVETTSPEEALSRDLWPSLPRGRDAARLRRLMSEIEMWLFEHEVNARRRSRGSPTISGLWLWGGGPIIESLPAVEGWTAGKDPMFNAFAPRSHYPGAAASGVVASGVVVIGDWPGTSAWSGAEERWLAPALADLAARRLSSIDLSLGDRSLTVSTRGLRRFWCRVRPWWEIFGVGEGGGAVEGGDEG